MAAVDLPHCTSADRSGHADMTTVQHVVMFSGGATSWAAAKRVAAQHGTQALTLLFTDTRMEDEDLYRFLSEAAANVGAPLIRIAEGRTPWHVYFDKRFLGNSRQDPCSRILKREMADAWLDANRDPSKTRVYVGIDWSESHRFAALKARRGEQGWRYFAPLCEPPYIDKREVLAWLKREGIAPPRLYDLGFDHNNCGGFCCKAGQAHFANLLRTMPERYAKHERMEQAIRVYLERDVSVMVDRTGGTSKPLTMRELRERIESGRQIDMLDIGGCGCFTEETDNA